MRIYLSKVFIVGERYPERGRPTPYFFFINKIIETDTSVVKLWLTLIQI